MSSAVVRSKPRIRETVPQDITELSRTMREEDRKELHHSSRSTPLDALLEGVRLSADMRTIEWDGRVVAIFGVTGEEGRWGSPWMLGTDDLSRCWSLLRECRKVLDGYTARYRSLSNAVWSGNPVHIQWIKWLGFTFLGSSDVRNGEVFLHFQRNA